MYAFSGFMHEYLNRAVNADQCAQYMDDFVSAAKKATSLTRNIQTIFECISKAGLKCQLKSTVQRSNKSNSLVGSFHLKEFHHKRTYSKFSSTILDSPIQENFHSATWVSILPQNVYSQDGRRFQAILQASKSRNPINITSELKKTFDSVNKALHDACQLAMKRPLSGKQFVLRTYASFESDGYAVMMKDNPEEKIRSRKKTYAPVAFGSKTFSLAQLKNSIYSQELSAIYIAFLEFAHILWETTKPTIVLTDIKSVTRLFGT